jgi:hypothetical protein
MSAASHSHGPVGVLLTRKLAAIIAAVDLLPLYPNRLAAGCVLAAPGAAALVRSCHARVLDLNHDHDGMTRDHDSGVTLISTCIQDSNHKHQSRLLCSFGFYLASKSASRPGSYYDLLAEKD